MANIERMKVLEKRLAGHVKRGHGKSTAGGVFDHATEIKDYSPNESRTLMRMHNDMQEAQDHVKAHAAGMTGFSMARKQLEKETERGEHSPTVGGHKT